MNDKTNIEFTFSPILTWNQTAKILMGSICSQLNIKNYFQIGNWNDIQMNGEHAICLNMQNNLDDRVNVVLKSCDIESGPNAIVLRLDCIFGDNKFVLTEFAPYRTVFKTYYGIGEGPFSIDDILNSNFSENIKTFCVYNIDRIA